jgi:hypothetical protein
MAQNPDYARFESWVRYIFITLKKKNRNSPEFKEVLGIRDSVLYTYSVPNIDKAEDHELWTAKCSLAVSGNQRLETIPGAIVFCSIQDLANMLSVYTNLSPDQLVEKLSPRSLITPVLVKSSEKRNKTIGQNN